MRLLIVFTLLALIVAPNVDAEVKLNGKLVIQESFIGVKYLGEVTNDTETPITNVKVIVTAKDASEKVIDVADGYVDGYNDPEWRFVNSYIPAGATVPFMFFGDAEADSIASYTHKISYKTTSAVIENMNEVALTSELNPVENFLGTAFYGEVVNNSSNCIYSVEVIQAIKDINGILLEVENTYVTGENYMYSDTFHTDSMISPGNTAVFDILTSVDMADFGSYYTIINYEIAPESSYQYYGQNLVNVKGEINVVEAYGNAKYLGEIENQSERDIYFVNISLISRDSAGKIFDITEIYVDGTAFDLGDGLTTDSHIAPGEVAPFEVYSSATMGNIATFDYIISYEYSEEITSVTNNIPAPFMLKGNYPNPFNQTTTIEFMLPKDMPVELSIYNATGQKVEKLVNGDLRAGEHDITWNASTFTSGVYFYRLTSENYSDCKKLLLLK